MRAAVSTICPSRRAQNERDGPGDTMCRTEAELKKKMETLAQTRDYARSALHHTDEQVLRGCTEALALYGFW